MHVKVNYPDAVMQIREIKCSVKAGDIIGEKLENHIQELDDNITVKESRKSGIERRERILNIQPSSSSDLETRKIAVIARWCIPTMYTERILQATYVSFHIIILLVLLCFAAMNLGLDYEHHAVLIGYFYYIFHDRQALAIPFSYLSMFKEPWALLGFGLTLTYNGERGKQNKWFNYLFYPVHLLILGIIRMCLKI